VAPVQKPAEVLGLFQRQQHVVPPLVLLELAGEVLDKGSEAIEREPTKIG